MKKAWTDSITRSYAKQLEWNFGLPLFALLLLSGGCISGCTPANPDFGFTLNRIDVHTGPENLDISLQQRLVLSREAREAVDHGVPLFIQTELAVRPAGSWRELTHMNRSFEIRYLPLSKRYQLTPDSPMAVKTFPRLRHVLAELASLQWEVPVSSLPPRALEIRARSRLEKWRMPPPMRLPAWLSSQWQHDTGWVSKTIQPSGP